MKQFLCLIAVLFLSFGLLLPARSQNESELTAEINIKSGYDGNPTENADERVMRIDQEDQKLDLGYDGPTADAVKIYYDNPTLYTAHNIPREAI